IYFWFPKMFGRCLSEPLGKLHFWLTLPLVTLVFGGQLAAGWGGQPRRLYNPYAYAFVQHLHGLNVLTSHAAFTLFAAQLVFVANFFMSLRSGPKAAANPWQVGTL